MTQARRATTPLDEVVLQRGLEAFAELGYDQTTVRELARRLGVSHNFVNDRYGSKMAFWRAVVDYASAQAGPETGDADAGLADDALLAAVVHRFYRAAARNPLLHRLVVDESARESPRIEYLHDAYIGPALAVVAPSVARLVAAGRVPDVPLHLLYFAVIGPVTGLVQTPLARRLGRPDGGEPEASADALAALIVAALVRPDR
ncbi:TetR family transcriptional regulator [Pseudonocardia sp. CNS-139]|nr:TetR family transcriptional regulator [Pseudonocardia sp. CNS-139]